MVGGKGRAVDIFSERAGRKIWEHQYHTVPSRLTSVLSGTKWQFRKENTSLSDCWLSYEV